VIAETRIWRTSDGKHVLDDDPAAALLAYTPGDDVPDEVVNELTGDTKPVKQARPAANKARSKPADK